MILALLVAVSLYQEALGDYQRQQYKQAEAKLRKVLATAPGSFDARFLLGATLIHLDRGADAIVELRSAVSLNPGHLDARKLLATEYLRAGQPGAVIDLFPNRLSDEETHLLLLQAYHDRGDAPDAEAAVQLALRGLSRFPRSARLNTWLGYALGESGRTQEARQRLEKAIALDQADPLPRVFLAGVLAREQNFGEAIRLYREVLAASPDDVDARVGLARALASAGLHEEALAALKGMPESSPRLHLELSRIYSKMGRGEEAARHAEIYRRLK